MPHDLATLVDAHLDAYADPDPARRRAAIERLWTADGRLVDPPLAAEGHDAIDRQAALLQAQFPGHRFVRSSTVDAHHGTARYAWQLRDGAGAVVLEGLDVADVDEAGRLSRVTGFFGPLPPLASKDSVG